MLAWEGERWRENDGGRRSARARDANPAQDGGETPMGDSLG